MIDGADLNRVSLNPDDIARVAEFFDCDARAAYEFVRTVWLPDAKTTAGKIAAAIQRREWTSLLFLCDHLREGARCVGAQPIMIYACRIERAADARKLRSLTVYAKRLRQALEALGALLVDSVDGATALSCQQ